MGWCSFCQVVRKPEIQRHINAWNQDASEYWSGTRLVDMQNASAGVVCSKPPLVAIVVLNWNGWQDTIECIDSILQSDFRDFALVVVDNASSDTSIRRISEWTEYELRARISSGSWNELPSYPSLRLMDWPEVSDFLASVEQSNNKPACSSSRFVLLRNCCNEGYAGGNNLGIRFARKAFNPSYIMVLNNDTVVENDFLTHLVRAAVRRDDAGVIGPAVFWYNVRDRIQPSAGYFNMWFGRRIPVRLTERHIRDGSDISVGFVSGVCMLIRASLFEEIGYFDADYFMYVEDVDFCYRARAVGRTSLLTPCSRIYHKTSKSSREAASEFMSYHVYRNAILFMKKNSRWYHWPTFLGMSAAITAVRILQTAVTDRKRVKSMVAGLIAGFSSR